MFAAMSAAPGSAAADGAFERDVLAELNRVRQDPAGYAAQLAAYRRFYTGTVVATPGAHVRYQTEEGVAPVDEAIAFLHRQRQLDALRPAAILRSAAADHCADQADDGAVGHVGRDGSDPGARVERAGGGRYVGELIAYGADDAADVVRQLIVDDGVPDRGHRLMVFARDIAFAGVSCGRHPAYRTMCVVDVARTSDGRSRAAARFNRLE